MRPGTGGAAARQRAERRGRRGEAVAALWLRLKGYRILARRLETPAGEIDILARRGAVIAVVEVKTRPEAGLALASVSPRQRARIARAALYVLARLGADQALRFDVVAIRPWRLPVHVRDAWRPDAGI